MMKTPFKTINLRFFQDEANGSFGLAHAETFDYRHNSEGFNAFWDGIGMFHDVFEHSHEFTHKYFTAKYAMNVGGELAAMGSMWYYVNEMGLGNRLNSGFDPGESMRNVTFSEVQDAISYGVSNYGSTLESNVPKQSPVYNESLEEEIKIYWNDVKELKFIGLKSAQEKYNSDVYKKSMRFGKVANLYRYGFRMAEKMIPDTNDNRNMLYNFIQFWNKFTNNNLAEDLMRSYRGISIKLYKKKGIVSWKAFLENNNYGEPDFEITTNNNIEDLLIEHSLLSVED